MNDVIIAGGDGFVGSHLAKHLAFCGYTVYALVVPNNFSKKSIENIDNIIIIEGDLLDPESYSNKLPMYPAAFFNFAWIGVSPEQRNDITVQRKNIDLTINSIELANKLKARKYIFPGSTFEYIYSNSVINRNSIPSPCNAYGVTKLSSKYYAQLLCDEYDIDFIYTVVSSIYSEDRIDNNVITYTIKTLLKGETPNLTKLEQKWDYVHIDDVVSAFEHIVRKGKKDSFYVIGHGDNWELSNYIYKIRDLIDTKLDLGIGNIPYKNDVLPMSCVDLSELQEDTGYVPQIDFEEGIVKVINKMKEMENK